MKHSVLRVGLTAIAALWASDSAVSAAWEPVRPVEFIVPAGTGGGADQMARTIQGIITKHNLMKQRWSSSTSPAAPAAKAFST